LFAARISKVKYKESSVKIEGFSSKMTQIIEGRMRNLSSHRLVAAAYSLAASFERLPTCVGSWTIVRYCTRFLGHEMLTREEGRGASPSDSDAELEADGSSAENGRAVAAGEATGTTVVSSGV